MSIENTLERIATALEAIVHASLGDKTDTAAPEKPARAPRAAKPSAEATSPTTTTEPEPASGETETAGQAASDTDEAPSASTDLTYEGDVKPLVLKVGATKGRDAALALLAEFEVSKADQIDAAEWPAFIARANEVLG